MERPAFARRSHLRQGSALQRASTGLRRSVACPVQDETTAARGDSVAGGRQGRTRYRLSNGSESVPRFLLFQLTLPGACRPVRPDHVRSDPPKLRPNPSSMLTSNAARTTWRTRLDGPVARPVDTDGDALAKRSKGAPRRKPEPPVGSGSDAICVLWCSLRLGAVTGGTEFLGKCPGAT